jgi:hypothetical protein
VVNERRLAHPGSTQPAPAEIFFRAEQMRFAGAAETLLQTLFTIPVYPGCIGSDFPRAGWINALSPVFPRLRAGVFLPGRPQMARFEGRARGLEEKNLHWGLKIPDLVETRRNQGFFDRVLTVLVPWSS